MAEGNLRHFAVLVRVFWACTSWLGRHHQGMNSSPSQRRKARRMVSLHCGDALGALGGPMRCTATYRTTKRGTWMRKRFYTKIPALSPDEMLQCFVEAVAHHRNHEGYRGTLAAMADFRPEPLTQLREATKWVGMLSQMLTTDADETSVRRCATDLLDDDFGRVWQVGLWSNMSWQNAHAAAEKLRSSDEWEMAAALCRNSPVDDLVELQELSKAVMASQRQGRSQHQRIR
jgi:hypothetical protein